MSVYRIAFDCRFSAKKDQYATVDIVLFFLRISFQIRDVRSPVTFIHGTDDPVVPIAHPKRLFLLLPPELRYRNLVVVGIGKGR